jgi:hypothetical protein
MKVGLKKLIDRIQILKRSTDIITVIEIYYMKALFSHSKIRPINSSINCVKAIPEFSNWRTCNSLNARLANGANASLF